MGSNLLSKDKETMRLVKAAIKSGWSVTKCGSNHIKFIPPNKDGQILVFSSTPGGKTSTKRDAERLRKQGVQI